MNVSSIDDEMAKKQLNEIPEEILEKSQQVFSIDEDPIMVAQSDLSLEGFYQDNWLIITDTHIAIFTLVADKAQEKKEDQEKAEKKVKYTLIELEKIKEVSIKRYVGNAFLRAKIDGKSKNILRFSLSFTQRFEWIATKIRKIMGEVEEEQFEEADLEDMTKERMEYEDRCPSCGRKLPAGMKVCPKCIDKKKIFKRMFKYLKPYWKLALLGFLLLLGVTILNQIPPYITMILLDEVFANQNFDLFYKVVTVFIIIHISKAVFVGVRTYILQWVGQRITLDLRSAVYAHVQKLSMNYYTSNRTGKIMNRVTTDTGRLQQFLVNGMQQLLNHIFTIIIIIVILFNMDWKLALISLSPVPIIMGLTVLYANTIHKIYHRIYRRVGDMKAILGDTIPGVKVVKAFTKENEEIHKFDNQLDEVFTEQMKATKTRSLFRPAMAISTSIGAIIIWAYGGYNVLLETGRLTEGMLIAFIQYMWRFYTPVQAMARLSGQYESALTSAERVFNVLDIEPETDDYDHSNLQLDKKDLNGEVKFENVSFTYEGEDEGVLHHINLTVKPGQTIGLVGPTGAGKTTFVNLLPRFYDVTRGSIKLDGHDLKDFNLQWLRRQIGIVPQHPFLFYGTISENIAYGIKNAQKEDIIRAAKMANAHDFIMDFPMGYDTHVGERGVGLSGGERQRVSIARAILKNAKIMILDEATSSVDTETESKIQNAIDRLIEGRTTFVIAHRLSTLKNADKLIVLEDGKLAEEGTHEELLNKENGVFKRLWDMQSNITRIDM